MTCRPVESNAHVNNEELSKVIHNASVKGRALKLVAELEGTGRGTKEASSGGTVLYG